MIELTDLSQVYHHGDTAHQVLKDIQLTVQQGEIFGIIGASGSGKSTLLRCINLLERPNRGSIAVAGQDLMQLTKLELRVWRQRIGMVFQHFNLMASCSVFDNVALAFRLRKLKEKQFVQHVADLLEQVGMQDYARHYPYQLSGGQCQRVAIARALADNPRILLCDEPTSALDAKTAQQILELLVTICKQKEITIILVSHALEVVKQICNRIAVLDQGMIVEVAESVHFFSKPQSNVGKSLIQAASRDILPLQVQARLHEVYRENDGLLLRVCFHDKVAGQPIIAQAIQRFHILINIHIAKVEYIQHAALGTMLIEVQGTEEKFKPCIAFFKENGVDIKKVGYVTPVME